MKHDNNWTISDRDSEMHHLEWGRKNTKKLKKEVMKFYDEIGETIDLKKEYPGLFK